MSKMQKVKGFVKDHKTEILIGAATVVVVAVCGRNILRMTPKVKCPYSTTVWSDNKDYINAITDYFNTWSGEKTNGAYIACKVTNDEIVSAVNDLVGDNGGDYLYSMIIERKKKFE